MLIIVFIPVVDTDMNSMFSAIRPYTLRIVLDFIKNVGSVGGGICVSLNFKGCSCVGLWAKYEFSILCRTCV